MINEVLTMLSQGDPGHLVTQTDTLSLSKANFGYRGIESLPPEILSHIFIIGSDELKYEDFRDFGDNSGMDDIDDDDDDEPMHFATLCSYVCQYWRNIAIDTCQLWSYLAFDGSSGSLERSKVWLARSKDVPVAIDVDFSSDEPSEGGETRVRTFSQGRYDDVSYRILDLILPHAHRWKLFVLQTESYDLIWLWQTGLAPLSSAPVLEHIGMFCYTEWIDEEVFHPPMFRSPQVLFPLGTPNIRSVVLWGVHFDWKSATFFAGLESLHLAWHTKDVRPTTEQFVQALSRSPMLETLNLEGSAPLPGTWPQERILLPNLRRLGLVQTGLSEALSVVDHIDFPALAALKLDLEVDNVDLLIRAFCQSNQPRLGSLQILKVASFQCSRDDGKLLLSTLVNVKSMILDFNYLPLHFWDTLTSSPPLCPRLEMLKLSGLMGRDVKALIKARKRSPTPIRRLYLDDDDYFSTGTVRWLRREVETLEFFQNSDVESDGGEDEENDEEDAWTDDTQGCDWSGVTESDEQESESTQGSDRTSETESDDGESEES